MAPPVSTYRRAVYLRPDAIARLMAPTGVPGLTRKQQAAVLGIPYGVFWRLTNDGQRSTDLGIAELVQAAQRLADRFGVDPLRFEDLFEVRPTA